MTTATTKSSERKEYEMNVSFLMVGPAHLYVVKTQDGRYLRVAGLSFIAVQDRALATRFDSATWAAHVAAQMKDCKPVRLKRKSTSEYKSWVYTKPIDKTSGEAPSCDGSAERAQAQSEPAGPPRETAGATSTPVKGTAEEKGDGE